MMQFSSSQTSGLKGVQDVRLKVPEEYENTDN
jgi:hypothetical protein